MDPRGAARLRGRRRPRPLRAARRAAGGMGLGRRCRSRRPDRPLAPGAPAGPRQPRPGATGAFADRNAALRAPHVVSSRPRRCRISASPPFLGRRTWRADRACRTIPSGRGQALGSRRDFLLRPYRQLGGRRARAGADRSAVNRHLPGGEQPDRRPHDRAVQGGSCAAPCAERDGWRPRDRAGSRRRQPRGPSGGSEVQHRHPGPLLRPRCHDRARRGIAGAEIRSAPCGRCGSNGSPVPPFGSPCIPSSPCLRRARGKNEFVRSWSPSTASSKTGSASGRNNGSGSTGAGRIERRDSLRDSTGAGPSGPDGATAPRAEWRVAKRAERAPGA